MKIKDILIAGIIIIVVAFVLSFVFSPSSSAHDTNLQILNKGDFGSNSTIYIKLTDNNRTALSGKAVHVKITDNQSNVIYDETVKTHATGVAMAKLANVSAGEYNIEVSFDGDENFTGSHISKKINVEGGYVEDIIDNETSTDDSSSDSPSTPSQSSSSSQSSYRPTSQSQQPASDDSDDDGSDVYYDPEGNPVEPTFDPEGNPTYSTEP